MKYRNLSNTQHFQHRNVERVFWPHAKQISPNEKKNNKELIERKEKIHAQHIFFIAKSGNSSHQM